MRTWAFVVIALAIVVPARAQNGSVERLSLEQAIAVALTREPSTRVAAADLEMARGMRRQAALRANPTLSFERRAEPAGSDRSVDLSVEWPLDLFRRRPRLAVLDAEVEVAEHEAADVRQQLAGEVAIAYGEVAAANRQLAITDRIIAAASDQLELLRARAAEGSAPALDRDMADVDLRRLHADRLTQTGRVQGALLALKRRLGMPVEAALELTQTLEELSAAELGNSSTSDLVTRPDVRVAEARMRAAESRIGAARSEARPDITLFGSYMRMNSGFAQRAFNTAGQLERIRGQFNYVTGGVMVTIPVWNREQGSIAATTAARDAAQARADAARLTASAEVAEARVRYEYAGRAVALYQDTIRPLAQRNLDVVRETYTLGRATVVDVLTEQRRYLETEQAYTEALSDAYRSRINLRRATGELP
jgi:cobalt-zinc-cadmium efflux system outer membrane protein